MNAAPVLIEQPGTEPVIQKIATASRTAPVQEKDHEAFFIVLIAVVIAFTFTVCVIGTILILLALRGSGVMAGVLPHFPQIDC